MQSKETLLELECVIASLLVLGGDNKKLYEQGKTVSAQCSDIDTLCYLAQLRNKDEPLWIALQLSNMVHRGKGTVPLELRTDTVAFLQIRYLKLMMKLYVDGLNAQEKTGDGDG